MFQSARKSSTINRKVNGQLYKQSFRNGATKRNSELTSLNHPMLPYMCLTLSVTEINLNGLKLSQCSCIFY